MEQGSVKGIAHITLKSGQILSCIIRGETDKDITIQVLRVISDTLFNYSSGIPKTLNKNKISKIKYI
jgi:hypothetical protein